MLLMDLAESLLNQRWNNTKITFFWLSVFLPARLLLDECPRLRHLQKRQSNLLKMGRETKRQNLRNIRSSSSTLSFNRNCPCRVCSYRQRRPDAAQTRFRTTQMFLRPRQTNVESSIFLLSPSTHSVVDHRSIRFDDLQDFKFQKGRRRVISGLSTKELFNGRQALPDLGDQLDFWVCQFHRRMAVGSRLGQESLLLERRLQSTSRLSHLCRPRLQQTSLGQTQVQKFSIEWQRRGAN